MKIKVFFLLAIVGLTKTGQGQLIIINGLPVFQSGTSEMYFNDPNPGSLSIKFDFLFSGGNRMNLEFNSISQVDSLPQINELLGRVFQDLKIVEDSLRIPLSNRRIDYYVSVTDTRIRTTSYAQRSDVYRIRNNEVNRLKAEQDTLRIRLYTWYKSDIPFSSSFIGYYYITFIVNDMSQLQKIASTDQLENAITMLKRELYNKTEQKKHKKPGDSYYALFDVSQNKRLLPLKGFSMVRYSDKSISLPPILQTGIQFIRGSWAVSLGVGLELVDHKMETQERHYGVFWEPYYFFDRKSEDKTEIDKNSFISFRYTTKLLSSVDKQKVVMWKSFGIGYLINGAGNWFERNTIKLSLPGMQTRSFLVEPEFFFYKFFKGFNPSLKVILYVK